MVRHYRGDKKAIRKAEMVGQGQNHTLRIGSEIGAWSVG